MWHMELICMPDYTKTALKVKGNKCYGKKEIMFFFVKTLETVSLKRVCVGRGRRVC